MKKGFLGFLGVVITIFFSLLLVIPPLLVSFGQEKVVTLEDYWNQKAKWQLVRKLDLASTGWGYGYGAGAHVEIVDGIWYLFSRKVNWGDKPNYCPFLNETLGTEVRKSLDKGKTWSQPINIIIPQESKPWECAATDGDAYYDATQNKWHYLFQCLSRNGVWNGCHLEKSGSNPMGLFTETHANPVIPARALWGRICDNPSDDCVKIPGGVNRVYDEGTYNIFRYDGGYYFVSFHGFDDTRGYRGIAKTADFINWIAGDENQGVPKDAVLDLYDTAGWRESWNSGGSIGFGAGSILFDNGYYYQISEAADINLGCTDGQNWDWGIFRSTSLTNTSWEQFPAGNPIIYSSKYPERNGRPIGCNPAYARLFKDPETNIIYLHYTRESMDNNYSGIYIFQLVPSSNLLQNGDLWKCNSENWQKFPIGPTNLVVYRYPNFSSDGGCYLAANCGSTSCQAGQSIYQDINVSSIPSRNISYGGKFATDSGTGTLNLVVFELDKNFAIINSHRTTLNPIPEYQSVRKDLTLSSQTKTVRFQLYLDSPHTFKADEMFFETVEPTSTLSLSPGWNEITWPDVSGKKASDTPPECPIAVTKENFWFVPFIKNFGGVNFDFESGRTYHLKCNQEVTWNL